MFRNVHIERFRGIVDLAVDDFGQWSTDFYGLDTERPIRISGREETTQLTREVEIRPKVSENRYSKETVAEGTETAIVEDASNESTRSGLLHALNGLSLHYVGRSGKQKK